MPHLELFPTAIPPLAALPFLNYQKDQPTRVPLAALLGSPPPLEHELSPHHLTLVEDCKAKQVREHSAPKSLASFNRTPPTTLPPNPPTESAPIVPVIVGQRHIPAQTPEAFESSFLISCRSIQDLRNEEILRTTQPPPAPPPANRIAMQGAPEQLQMSNNKRAQSFLGQDQFDMHANKKQRTMSSGRADGRAIGLSLLQREAGETASNTHNQGQVARDSSHQPSQMPSGPPLAVARASQQQGMILGALQERRRTLHAGMTATMEAAQAQQRLLVLTEKKLNAVRRKLREDNAN
ncbi:hypothetical protein EJ04DRAFT_526395 [Polyplosphaeria fusca]|uniref:Uncharacterized protein n=1 Tax=Polyplosphaeria fusca TaxID=682080 RepID=A0A9P4QUB7_9PLEO|nr:hypothetical protein EJ04DRAFT_526395 [Polyplosphaeria fusca]